MLLSSYDRKEENLWKMKHQTLHQKTQLMLKKTIKKENYYHHTHRCRFNNCSHTSLLLFCN